MEDDGTNSFLAFLTAAQEDKNAPRFILRPHICAAFCVPKRVGSTSCRLLVAIGTAGPARPSASSASNS